jgi:hypothetical protein
MDAFEKAEKLIELQEKTECQRCGHCCTQTENIVLTPYDLKMIAWQHHQTIDRARAHFTRIIDRDHAIRGIKKTLPCMFYDPLLPGCSIYEIRPAVCRTFPFKSQPADDTPIVYYNECPASNKALESI